MSKKRVGADLWAPKCSFPGCENRVRYHRRNKKVDGSYSFKWKAMCEYHRAGAGKAAVDSWKLSRGCENKDGRLGFECIGSNFKAHHLDVEHKDCNNLNREPENIQVICKFCHPTKTMENKDHLNRYTNRVDLSNNLFEVCP